MSDIVIADLPNRVWAVDFQFDSTTDGRPIKNRAWLWADIIIYSFIHLMTVRGTKSSTTCPERNDWRCLLRWLPPDWLESDDSARTRRRRRRTRVTLAFGHTQW